MTLKSDDAKFEEKLTCGLENDMRNLAKCYQSNWKSQNWKFIEELCIMTMRNDTKFEEESTCRFKTDTIIWRILTPALACLKNLHLMSSFYLFWPRYIIFELKKYRRVLFDCTKNWCKIWRKTDLRFPKRHEEFESLLICFENCQGVPYSNRRSRNRMMNTFIKVNITPTCKRSFNPICKRYFR